mmetsp:Transcript_35862/g.89993  ORF Transcript_35862/g.89993 Transcript_35862/m.89993 type:complete len:249 (-) Transcript_35862:1639-2385(-)
MIPHFIHAQGQTKREVLGLLLAVLFAQLEHSMPCFVDALHGASELLVHVHGLAQRLLQRGKPHGLDGARDRRLHLARECVALTLVNVDGQRPQTRIYLTRQLHRPAVQGPLLGAAVVKALLLARRNLHEDLRRPPQLHHIQQLLHILLVVVRGRLLTAVFAHGSRHGQVLPGPLPLRHIELLHLLNGEQVALPHGQGGDAEPAHVQVPHFRPQLCKVGYGGVQGVQLQELAPRGGVDGGPREPQAQDG